MAEQGWTTNTRDLIPDPARYQVDDLIIDLAPRRVRRADGVIRLQALSFDLLTTLVRAAPNLVTFDQLGERVWPGLVVTPETIVQRVKLLRSALGDDAHAPRYIEGVRGRGYRMVAQVHPVEKQGNPEFIVPPSFKEVSSDGHASVAVTGAAAVSSPSATPLAARRSATWVPLGWVGGTLIIAVLLAASWGIVRYRGGSKSAERTSLGMAPATIRSLAVLPLENLSGDKEQEYFADGMTDALTTDLAQIGSLRVISRTSAMHFKGSKETLPQIGRDLHVDAVVEGAVTRGQNRVRVTAQLVEASSDHHLWARTYERDLKDVLVLQDEIAHDIAQQIQVKLTPKARSLRIQVHAVDPEAYDAYLRGSYWLNQDSLEGFKKGCDYFQKATDKDPNYASAYVGLAICQRPPGKIREQIAKALVLDPSLAEAHTWLATMKLMMDWDWSGAEAEHKRAIALNPNYAPAHRWYSGYLVAAGRLDEALRETERARDLDPYSASVTEWLGQVLYHARRYDDALREMRRGLEMYPDAPDFYSDMADVYEQKKMFAEAFAARQQALRAAKDPRVTALGEAYKRSGYKGYLLKLAELEQTENPPFSAHCYALLDDKPRAIGALEVAYNKRMGTLLFMRSAPELDSIRSSPRYRDLVRRIGFPLPTSIKSESMP
jgi:TolB-like protein/DNA-binding winged helix-turn-helix (wHTH) protein/Tfp pilus assembly protein PilF